ncbi:MAG: hypothetical protein Q8N37_00325 [bacterium]|nr:hypothetical protein [bacterium]
MFNKTIKIIIGIIILALVAFAIFLFKDTENNNGNGGSENIVNRLPESENIASILEELKNNHPEFSASQLEFYRETAKSDKEIIKLCKGRGDENDCIASVAFIKGESAVCGEIENSKIRIECANAILQRLGVEKIDKCWSFDGYDLMHCLRNIFVMYDKPEDCLNLKSEKTQQVCESVFYYEIAFIQHDGELCKKITNEKLNQYCFENAGGKFPDSDNDGLTDYEEINKYHTDPANPDTDGDGYTDGDEVKNGFNPLGEGKLKF